MKNKLLIFFVLLIPLQGVNYLIWKYKERSINEKMIFGLAGGNLTSIIISMFILGLLYIVIKRHKGAIKIFYALISAAVVSNILDRFFYGGVVDYINLLFIPTFNLADILLVAGIVLLSYQLVFKPKIA